LCVEYWFSLFKKLNLKVDVVVWFGG
jgi:hypothetical protein